MTQSPSIRLVTELALANRGFVTLPSGGVDGNVLVKSGGAVAWGAGAGGTAVNSVNGRTGAVLLSKSDVALGNADNTSDSAKPVSSATQTALNAKADYPPNGVDGQVLSKSGSTTAWIAAGSGTTTVTLINTTDSITTILNKLLTPGVVRFQPGTYNVGANTLYVYGTSPTWVQGYGAIINSTMNDAMMRINNAAHVVEGLSFVGQGVATTVQGGIIAYSNSVTITRCNISNVARFAILTNGDNNRIVDNVTDNTSIGPDHGAGSIAAIFNAGNGVLIQGNVCTNTFWGISNRGNSATDPILDGIITGNRISAKAGSAADAQGISSAHARHQKITFNTIRDYPNNSIDQYGAFYSEIVGNTCVNGSSDGIFVGHVDTHSITVANNNIYNCVGSGIRVWDTAHDVKVIGNSIWGLGDGGGSIGIFAAGSINAGENDIANVDIQNNYIVGDHQTGNTHSVGIVVRHASVVDISGNTIRDVSRQGIYSENTDIATVRNNRVQDAGQSTATTYAAIHTAVGCNRFLIDDDVVYGNADIAVRVESGVGHRVKGLRWRSVTTGVSDTATSTLLSDNLVM